MTALKYQSFRISLSIQFPPICHPYTCATLRAQPQSLAVPGPSIKPAADLSDPAHMKITKIYIERGGGRVCRNNRFYLQKAVNSSLVTRPTSLSQFNRTDARRQQPAYHVRKDCFHVDARSHTHTRLNEQTPRARYAKRSNHAVRVTARPTNLTCLFLSLSCPTTRTFSAH